MIKYLKNSLESAESSDSMLQRVHFKMSPRAGQIMAPFSFFSQLSFVAFDTNREMSEMSVSDVKILLIVRFSIQEPRSYVVADVAFCMLQHL